VSKMSISMEQMLGDEVRAAAERDGVSLSAWLSAAAQARLRRQALAAFLAAWQDEHGPITPDELAKARAELGLPSVGGNAA
jgi:hypothetical protein